jgi:hypothetical protein
MCSGSLACADLWSLADLLCGHWRAGPAVQWLILMAGSCRLRVAGNGYDPRLAP